MDKNIFRRLFFYVSIFSIVLLSFSEVFAQESAKYLFYYKGQASFQDFKNHLDKIDIIAPAAYSFDQDGILWGEVDQRVIKLAKENNIGVMPLIKNSQFNQQLLHNLFKNEKAKQRLIETLVSLCKRYGFMGIQFDCENINIRDKNGFTSLYKEAADSLHKYGFKISAAVVHILSNVDIPTEYFKWLYENWRAGYNLSALDKAGDFISIMTYSQHTRRTTPGPLAGLPWVTNVIEYVLKYVHPEKLSLGIPFGSQHWYTSLDTLKYFANARSWSENLDYNSAKELAERFNAKILWNEKQKVPYTVFDNGGLFEYIYFEDARSFKAKFDLIEKFKLAGFSAWVLGREDPKIWDLIPSHSK